ncbi:hypothetical protein GGQ64_004585 [Rhizobium azooxidifex]|uniref:Uncharacterized protein n=1 Tax=Mycoplana azooxidifex TaxID=1636188 RepID=A0A7W6D9Z0_9HYPH|nr:hypothetical protein [Mycoplana azooxidifex]MBB3979345.1 hypothetical protein [Mycoplana azooxidifex]
MASWRDRLRSLHERVFGRAEVPPTSSEPDVSAASDDKRPGVTEPPDFAQGAPVVAENAPAVRARVPTRKAPATVKTQAKRAAVASNDTPPRSTPKARPLAINLGIDFGTSFTKVCFRDLGSEVSGTVAAGKGGKEALVPSIVAIGSDGRLFLGDSVSGKQSAVIVPYLKMRLAGGPIGERLPEFEGIDLNKAESVRALAAWFLASVIQRSQQWLAVHEADRLKNRVAVWSANVGVPVEHYDSQALATFEEVLGIAWLWVKDDLVPKTLQEALPSYRVTQPRLVAEVTDFHAVPEIAAAVQSFVMSREAVAGIYVYFDVGGGTVDGVAFNYRNILGERRINFYSGKVEPLGISAIGASLAQGTSGDIDAVRLEKLLKACSQSVLAELVLRIRKVVAYVIMTARLKDGRNWQEDAFQNADYERKFIGKLSTSRMRPLIVFIGGGGSKSEWYKNSIESTYRAFKHHNAGVPPYKLVEVPRPKDFIAPKGSADEFIRFAISYGLSFPFGEGPDIGLPSQFGEAEKPRQWVPPGAVNYADSKDYC